MASRKARTVEPAFVEMDVLIKESPRHHQAFARWVYNVLRGTYYALVQTELSDKTRVVITGRYGSGQLVTVKDTGEKIPLRQAESEIAAWIKNGDAWKAYAEGRVSY